MTTTSHYNLIIFLLFCGQLPDPKHQQRLNTNTSALSQCLGYYTALHLLVVVLPLVYLSSNLEEKNVQSIRDYSKNRMTNTGCFGTSSECIFNDKMICCIENLNFEMF